MHARQVRASFPTMVPSQYRVAPGLTNYSKEERRAPRRARRGIDSLKSAAPREPTKGIASPVPMMTPEIVVHSLYLVALFGSYCQMAPAMTGATKKPWEPGKGVAYELSTNLLFREAGPARPGGDVGFQLTGQLQIVPTWKDPQQPDTVLLQFKLIKPKLWIKSRKAPEPEGFVEHSSKLQETSSKVFFAFWKNGDIMDIFLDPIDDVSIRNVKKGLIGLFQYKTLDGDYLESDASGSCNVTYTSMGPSTVIKRKNLCIQDHFPPVIEHPNLIFGARLNSKRSTVYELAQDLVPKKIRELERHEMILQARPEVGATVESERVLKLISSTVTGNIFQEPTLESVRRMLHNMKYRREPIELEMESKFCPETGCPILEKTLEENKEALETAALGSVKSATAFLKLVPLAREANTEDLMKILKSPKYRAIRPQLLDIFGAAATTATHQVAMKYLRQDENGDEMERYLWALSMTPLPLAETTKNILIRTEETMQNDKVSETMALTAAAMARQHGSSAVIEKARVSLELGLDSCSGEDCKLRFLRALKNLRSKAAIPTLLHYALTGSKPLTIVAWRALCALPPRHITKEVKSFAFRVFYQLTKDRQDSTVRTLAASIILENNPTVPELRSLLSFLASAGPSCELKKYLSQRIDQLAIKDPTFSKLLEEAISLESSKILNYNALAQKGLSTAFTRHFLRSPGSNGSLVTIQEVQSGLLKRGIVDVVLDLGNEEQAIFSLGLFAGGLGSFVSSEESQGSTEEDTPTAGMEVALMGVDVRPFVFFTGQGELMGHVWSGTASERTPAFQVIAHLHRHKEYVPLGSGFVAEVEVNGAASFDLAGKIELSLWSRNAESLVEVGAGVAVTGHARVKTSFVQSHAEFLMTMEPKLELKTNLDFASQVSLCMRLMQPAIVVRHHVYKVERIPGSRHKLRKTRRTKLLSPARSYLLNSKNNEMCSKVFG